MMRIAACAVAAALAAGAQAVQLTDDRGATVTLEYPAERIVTLAPHLAEIAFAAGAGAKLVGVSSFSRHPAEAERLPVVASSGRVDIERVIALKPDVVLGWRSGNSPLQLAHLEDLGFRVFVTEVRSVPDIARLMREVGQLAGSAAIADERARIFASEVRDLRESHAGARSIGLFLEVWHRPMLTVNGEHLISDAISICGGRNVFAEAKVLTPHVSNEQLLAARPDAIVTVGYGSETPGAWRGLGSVPAVRDRRIYAIDPDLLLAQGPRFLDGARALCRRLEAARR
ncbi:MAG TPA: cobalamin-binding protein [Burkholderiales bacterium]|nr:cobalamin-binding protein [Burkholderiales bacterium]